MQRRSCSRFLETSPKMAQCQVAIGAIGAIAACCMLKIHRVVSLIPTCIYLYNYTGALAVNCVMQLAMIDKMMLSCVGSYTY